MNLILFYPMFLEELFKFWKEKNPNNWNWQTMSQKQQDILKTDCMTSWLHEENYEELENLM